MNRSKGVVAAVVPKSLGGTLDESNLTEEQKAALKAQGMKKGGKVIKEYGGMEKYSSKAAMKKHEATETPKEEKLEKKMGKNMARAMMQKEASKAVKGHEARMHKGMKSGGMVKRDGCAIKGKTKGRMV